MQISTIYRLGEIWFVGNQELKIVSWLTTFSRFLTFGTLHNEPLVLYLSVWRHLFLWDSKTETDSLITDGRSVTWVAVSETSHVSLSTLAAAGGNGPLLARQCRADKGLHSWSHFREPLELITHNNCTVQLRRAKTHWARASTVTHLSV